MRRQLQRYVAEHVLPVHTQKTDQTLDKVTALLNTRYGRSKTEKVEEAVEDLPRFSEENYVDDNDLIMAMRELNQRRIELKMTYNEFFSVWMLGKIKKQKKIEGFEIQALRDVVKEGGPEVNEKFKKEVQRG